VTRWRIRRLFPFFFFFFPLRLSFSFFLSSPSDASEQREGSTVKIYGTFLRACLLQALGARSFFFFSGRFFFFLSFSLPPFCVKGVEREGMMPNGLEESTRTIKSVRGLWIAGPPLSFSFDKHFSFSSPPLFFLYRAASSGDTTR